jgi:LacI family transcriptional regulator
VEARVKKASTLRDVADGAGVSLSTASKVLNGTGRAGPATRDRIFATAERLDFRPDALAKFFATGKSYTVGVLSDEEPRGFAMPVLIGAQKALGQRDLAALTYYADATDPDSHREHIRKLRARRVDGVLAVGGTPDVTVPSLRAGFTAPIVYAFLRSNRPDDIVVVPDGEMAGRLAAEHLLSIGRRRVAHVTGEKSHPAVQDRLRGLTRTLFAAGCALALDEPIYGDWSRDWGYDAAQRVLASIDRVDAIFCGNDKIALGLREALREVGVRVPDDVALVGYDNWSRLSDDRDCSLTTIDPNLQNLGAVAVEHLVRAMDGRGVPGLHATPCTLIPGGSTGAAPAAPISTGAAELRLA